MYESSKHRIDPAAVREEVERQDQPNSLQAGININADRRTL
jgi:hypothetical protein